MMAEKRIVLGLVAILAFGAGADARVKEQASPAGPVYMNPDDIDLVAILPPAPREGDPRAEADRAIFRATRVLEGTPRWALAISDVEETARDMLRGFSCAAGIELTPEMIPSTTRLLQTAASNASAANRTVKNRYQRQRPFHYDAGPLCEPRDHLADSFDYPSGHTTRGWTWAQILAELLPARATALLARGRSFGDSRIVCGAHNASAVEAGRLSGTVSLTRMRSSKAYQADLSAARAELARLTPRPQPDAARCQAEAEALSVPVL